VTEAVVAGAVAGAIAGAIVALAVALTMRQRDGGWRAYTARPGASQFRRGPVHIQRMTHTYTPGQSATPMSGYPTSGFSMNALDGSGQHVLAVAQDEAIQMNHNYIGTEHLLVGLIRSDVAGPAGHAFARLGITLDKARAALQFIVGKGQAPTSPSEITMSPRTQKVLELAMDETRKLGHEKVGAAEICLGLIREGEGIASGILESLGVPLEAVRDAVLAELAGQPAPPAGRPPEPRRQHASGPFDRFNDRAKRVLALAQDEAIRFNHNYIGPEHLLLGLVREGEGVAGQVLAGLGVDLSRARREVESLIGRGESTASPSEITLIPRTKKIIELAIDEARILGHGHVGTEHLLLGMVRDGSGTNAGAILKALGVDVERLRARVVAMISGEPGPGQPT
jgi:ATP-dependent Clp protease ATP-binding subunit ClpA